MATALPDGSEAELHIQHHTEEQNKEPRSTTRTQNSSTVHLGMLHKSLIKTIKKTVNVTLGGLFFIYTLYNISYYLITIAHCIYIQNKSLYFFFNLMKTNYFMKKKILFNSGF